MNNATWWEYVEQTIGADSALEAGRKAGFDSSAFTRWKKGANPDVAFVVKLARAYGRPVVEALAFAGYITDEEADVREVKVGASDLTEGELVDELARRIHARGTPSLTGGARITAFPTNVGGAPQAEDLDIATDDEVKRSLKLPHAARRGKRKADEAPFAE